MGSIDQNASVGAAGGRIDAGSDTYNSPATKVLPSVVWRAALLGVTLAAFSVVMALIAPQRAIDLAGSLGFAGGLVELAVTVATGVLVATVLVATLLSVAHYRNRRYEITKDAIIERKGILGGKNQLSHDEIEDVHLTRSGLQRLLGVGTVRINEDVDDDEGVTEDMRIRYVEKPEELYEELIERSGGVTTGSPVVVTEPSPKAALSSFRLFFALVAFFLAIPALLVTVLVSMVVEPSLFGTVVIFGAALGTPVAAYAGLVYLRYDRTRYEIYNDHVEKSAGANHTAVAYDDVDKIKHDRHGRFGHVGLFNDEDDNIMTLKFLEDSDGIRNRISSLAEEERLT